MRAVFRLGAIAAAARPAGVSSPYDTFLDRVEALLHMDGANGGTTFTDSSPRARSCSQSGVTTVTAQSKFGTASGLWSSGTHYVQVGSAASDFDWLSAMVESWTIEGWIRPADVSGTKAIFTKGSNATTEAAVLFILTGNVPGCAVYKSSSFGGVGANGNAITANAWHHVAASFDASDRTLRVAVNGIVSAPTTIPDASNYTTPNGRAALIGRYHEANVVWWDGHIDDFRITRGVARYLGNFSPPTAPFPEVGNRDLLLNFNGSNGSTTLTDSSPAARTVTANGSAALSTAQKKFGTASLALDGSSGCNATLAWPGTPGDFTAQAWVYVTDTGTSRDVLALPGILLYRQSGNVLGVYRTSGGATLGSTTFTANAWHHVAMTRKGSTIRFFLDGNLEGSVTDSAAYSSGTAYIGSKQDGSERWQGYIDDLSITLGAAIYTGNFTPQPSEAH